MHVRHIAVGVGLDAHLLHFGADLRLLHVHIGLDLGGLDLRCDLLGLLLGGGLLLLGLLFFAEDEPLRVEALHAARLFEPLLRVDAERGVHDQLRHLHDGLILQVALDKRTRSSGINNEVALGRLVLTVDHQPLVVATDVRLSDAVVERPRHAPQDRAGIVGEQRHAAHGLGSGPNLPALTLQQHGHARGLLGHL